MEKKSDKRGPHGRNQTGTNTKKMSKYFPSQASHGSSVCIYSLRMVVLSVIATFTWLLFQYLQASCSCSINIDRLHAVVLSIFTSFTWLFYQNLQTTRGCSIDIYRLHVVVPSIFTGFMWLFC